jgi:hypothetical protein
MTYHIEMERNNVTPAQFFAMIKHECKKQGIDFNLSREDFEHPHTEYMDSYIVVDGIKHCHHAHKEMVTKQRRKLASYVNGQGFTRHYYTDEFEEYQEEETRSHDSKYSADDAPCKAETYTQFAYDYQCYVLNFDGTCYNEICEFSFDDDKKGHGYYYQMNKE